MKYTVSLLYPKYAQDDFPETYLAWVQTEDYIKAMKVAKIQALRAQSNTKGWRANDFIVLHVFEGHVQDCQWGVR